MGKGEKFGLKLGRTKRIPSLWVCLDKDTKVKKKSEISLPQFRDLVGELRSDTLGMRICRVNEGGEESRVGLGGCSGNFLHQEELTPLCH